MVCQDLSSWQRNILNCGCDIILVEKIVEPVAEVFLRSIEGMR